MFSKLRRKTKDEDGSTTVEFVIIFPIIIASVLLIFESGWMMTRIMMLDRGLDMAMRNIRLGSGNLTHEAVVNNICDGAIILADCKHDLKLELKKNSDLGTWSQSTWSEQFPWNQASCIDDDAIYDDANPFNSPGDLWPDDAGVRNENVFIRACIEVDPIFPGLGKLLLGHNGGPMKSEYQLAAVNVFRSEPE